MTMVWRGLARFAEAWVLPVRAARRQPEAPGWGAALAHVGGVGIGVLMIWVISAFERQGRGPFPPGTLRMMQEDWRNFRLLLAEYPDEARRVAFRISIMVFVYELLAVLVAWALLAWAGGLVGVRAGWWRALKRLWLLTPHLMLLWVIFFAVLLDLDQRRRTFFMAQTEALRVGRDLSSEAPWYVRNGGYLLAPLAIGLGAAGLAVLLAGTAAVPWRPRSRWPAVCERCGYALLGLRPEQPCPECGLPVGESIGAHVRRGAPLDQFAWGRFPQLWARTAGLALRRPRELGARLQVFTPPRGHRRVLAWSLLAGGVLGWAGLVATALVNGWGRLAGEAVFEICGLGGLGVGVFTAWVLAGVMGASAAVVAVLQRFLHQRAVLAGAIQGSVYTMPILLAGLVPFWVVLALFDSLDYRTRRELGRAFGMDGEVFMVGCLFLVSCLVWIVHVVWAWRVAAGCRWANR